MVAEEGWPFVCPSRQTPLQNGSRRARRSSAVIRQGNSQNRWRDGRIFHIGFQPGAFLDCGGTFSLFCLLPGQTSVARASMSIPVMLFVLVPKEALAVL